MTASVIAAVIVFVIVMGVLTPAVAWLDRRRRALAAGKRVTATRSTTDSLADALPDLFRWLIDVSRWLVRDETVLPTAIGKAARIAPVVSFVAAATVFAFVPLGGRYAITHTPTSLVLADPEWGLLWLVVAPAAGVLGVALVGLTGSRLGAQLGGVRAAVQGSAGLLAIATSLLPMWILYGTARPTGVFAWQDDVIGVAAVLGRFGVEASSGWLSFVGLPAWGIVVNPLACALFFVAAMIVVGRPPFDAPSAFAGLSGGVVSELAGARRVLHEAAIHLWTLAFACAVVALFLGGGSVPWLPQDRIVSFVEPLFGSGFAALVCATAHVAAFVVKLALVLHVTLTLRWGLVRQRVDQVLALCLRVIVPLALIDAAITMVVVAPTAGPSP